MDWNICIRPSILLLRLQLGMHLMALLSLLLAELVFWVIIPLALTTFLSMLHLLGKAQISYQIEFDKDGIRLLHDGRSDLVRLRRQCYCSSYLQIIEFVSTDRKCHTLVILPDCANAESRRKLRLVLRWYLFPEHALCN
jgi:hypothetical protein